MPTLLLNAKNSSGNRRQRHKGKGKEGGERVLVLLLVQPQGHEIDKAIGLSGLLLKFRHRSLMPLLMVFDSP